MLIYIPPHELLGPLFRPPPKRHSPSSGPPSGGIVFRSKGPTAEGLGADDNIREAQQRFFHLEGERERFRFHVPSGKLT